MSGEVIRFRAFRVNEVIEQGQSLFLATVQQRSTADLPQGDVLIRVLFSSLNFKDALSARGNRGVTKQYPHTPGIDAAGVVVSSHAGNFNPGDKVIVIGYDLGMNTDGGFSDYVRVPSTWVVRLPEGLSLRQSMVLGTAGFTAALCVDKLLRNGLVPGEGEVLVTGATGGVGVVAVALLAQLGFNVTACTGKPEQLEYLSRLGASTVLERSQLLDASERPVLKERWAGAVDVAGGELLGCILRSLKYGGSVASCGLVGSSALNLTVLPFILRGVNLLGVDSVSPSLEEKTAVWERLATEWHLHLLDELARDIGFSELQSALDTIYAGRSVGRVVLDLSRPD